MSDCSIAYRNSSVSQVRNYKKISNALFTIDHKLVGLISVSVHLRSAYFFCIVTFSPSLQSKRCRLYLPEIVSAHHRICKTDFNRVSRMAALPLRRDRLVLLPKPGKSRISSHKPPTEIHHTWITRVVQFQYLFVSWPALCQHGRPLIDHETEIRRDRNIDYCHLAFQPSST